jgi:apolipoprotein D and lipocalin family protein
MNRVRRVVGIAIAVSSFFNPFQTVEAQVGGVKKPLDVVAHVDLSRYAGEWFEIARYPNRFQKDCVSDTTATYNLRDDGEIDVVNACKRKDGKLKTARGRAKIADSRTNAKLKVTFFWPFYGDYWIIDLDPDYRYAVVGDPGRRYLWILSRTPHLDETEYQKILTRIRDAGYDPERLMKTAQTLTN